MPRNIEVIDTVLHHYMNCKSSEYFQVIESKKVKGFLPPSYLVTKIIVEGKAKEILFEHAVKEEVLLKFVEIVQENMNEKS